MIAKVLLFVIFTLVDSAASFGLHHDDVIRTSPSSPEKKNSIDGNDEHSNRRLFLSSMTAASTVLLGISSPAYAAKGAAEYDFEYYMRDLL